MKREGKKTKKFFFKIIFYCSAVQEERQKAGLSGEGESPASPTASNGSGSNHMNMGFGSSSSGSDDEMLIEKLIAAELFVEPKIESFHEEECSYDRLLSTTHVQLSQLTDWAKRVPHFATLSIDDQVALVRASWRDILCCSLAYRSIAAPDCGLILSVSIKKKSEYRFILIYLQFKIFN
jgi:hypothetical protein